MQPVKILFCIDSLLRGGTELQLVGLIERLDPKKYTPYLLTIRKTDLTLTPKNCVHLHWNVPTLGSIAGVASLIKLIMFLRKEKISIVQTFFQDSTMFGGIAAYMAKVPTRIACFRDLGFWYTSKQAFVLKKIYSLMTGFICNADIVRDHFATLFSIPLEKMTVLRNGIDVEALPFISHTSPCKHVGIVGNMTRAVKRTDLFIKAAGIVAQQHPEITWHILGDGHLRTELEQLAKEKQVFEKIHFAGRVSNVSGYLEMLDIGIICSDSEGLSNALLEYMFKGTASVATAVGGNPELIEHEKTGLLVPPNDEIQLAAAITQLIENDALRLSICANARKSVEKEYSWENCIKKHADLYAKNT